MIRDVHISGQISERHEYFTTVVGPHLNIRLLYDGRNEPGRSYDRFFSGGSEIRVTETGVGHTGTGGAFCSYMFGVDIPEKDLLRRDVRNRLVMHGARYDDASDRLTFSADTAGSESYARIFNVGHAYANYYFFIAGDIQGNLATAQETILRVAGKFLKRHDLQRTSRDGRDLAVALHEACGVPQWTLFVVKVIDANAETYYARYRDAFAASREVPPGDRHSFDLLSAQFGLDPYQQERVHLDVIYEHGDNKKLIDSYKEAITAHFEDGLPEHELMPKLNLLRAFASRNKIPATIFDRLDALLMHASASSRPADPPFIQEARRVLEALFVDRVGSELKVDDIVALLHAKRQALEQRYVGFEAVLLDAAHASDEWARAGKSAQLRAQFEQIIDYLDLFDTASSLVNSIAFIDDFEITPPRLEELLETQIAFDELRQFLFERLFIEPLEKHQYLNIYGRRRIEALKRGLRAANNEPHNSRIIAESVRRVNETAKLHRLVEGMLRGIVGDVREDPLEREQKDVLRLDVEARLRSDYGITAKVDESLFESVLLGLEEEYFYAHKLLPAIVANRDLKLRESFLETSGVDRFRIEELEAAYLKDLVPRAASSAGGS